MAVILDHGVRSMMEHGKDEFYYITAMNENYSQPSKPEMAEAGIVKGLYLFASHGSKENSRFVRLLGSGAILPEVVEAAKMLDAEWNVAAEVWSATSYSELARDAREAERRNKLNPLEERVVSHLGAYLHGARPHRRDVRLCSRLPADDRLVCGCSIHRAGDGRFRAGATRAERCAPSSKSTDITS